MLAHRDGPGLAEPLRHRHAARARAAAQVARAAQDARARLDLGRDDRLRGRARVGADAGRRAGRRRDRARRHGRARGSSKPWVVAWPRSPGPPPLGARAHGAGRGAARGPQRRRAARARSASGSAARCPVTVSEQGADRRRRPARRAALRVRRARPGRPTSRCSRSAWTPSAARRCARSARSTPPARATSPAFAERPHGHRHAAQRAARLGRAADRRLAAAARAAGRARRVLPRPPPPRAVAPLGARGSPSPPCRCPSPGCGCARSARPGVIEAPDGPVLPRLFPLETSGIVAMASALLAGALACWRAAAGRAARRRARPRPRRPRQRRGRDPRRASTGSRSRPASWLCALAAFVWLREPVRRRRARPRRPPVAVRRGRLARAGRRSLAVLAGLVPPVLVVVHYGFALDLGPLELAGARRSRRAPARGLWSTLLLAGVRWPRWRARSGCCSRAAGSRATAPSGAGDQDPRPGQLRRSGLARRHRVGAAAMTRPPRRSRVRSALRALSTRADRLRLAAAGRRRRDAAVAGARLRASTPASSRASCRASSTAWTTGQADPGRAEGAREAARPEAPARVRGALAGPQDRRRRRRRQDPDRPRSGSRSVVVEGTDAGDLRKGPGHYPGTPLPGPARHGRDRRAPHDLRRAVSQDQQGPARATRSSS